MGTVHKNEHTQTIIRQRLQFYNYDKDIEAVMRLQSDLVRPVAEMTPIVTIMGGGEQYSNFGLE